MDKQKRTTIDEFSAYLQSAVRNTTINYMNDKSKIKEHEITLEEDLENVEGRGIEWNEMMEAHDIFLGKIDPEKLFAQVTDNKNQQRCQHHKSAHRRCAAFRHMACRSALADRLAELQLMQIRNQHRAD